MFNIGQPGALRLFIAPLSKEMSWLLPFGILSGLLLAFRKRIRWPIGPDHQVLVLWGGWLATTGVFFSVAGFFHEYYLSTMGPPLAALEGIGAAGLWQLHKQRPWLAFSLLSAGAVATLAFQAYTAQSYLNIVWWLPIVGVFVVGGILVLGAATLWKMQSTAITGFSFILIGLMVTPGIWSGLTTLKGTNSALPAAYGGQSSPGGFPGDQNGLQVNQTLLAYLEQNTQGMKYLMAVPSSHDGDGYILATGRPVLLMGGFSGSDPVVDGADLSQMVSEGELRYVLLSRGGPGNQNSSVSSWVRSNCNVVSELNLSAGSFQGGFPSGFGGGALYDCAE
jgi:4-amino-4-deoxy-L-arabinose transferase-like glycosyltransferase